MPGQTDYAFQVFQDCIGGQPVGLRRRTGEYGRDVIPRGLLSLGRGVRRDRRARRRATRSRTAMLVRTQIEFERPGLRRSRVHADAGDLQQSQHIHFRRQTDGHGPVRPDVGPSRTFG